MVYLYLYLKTIRKIFFRRLPDSYYPINKMLNLGFKIYNYNLNRYVY